MKEFFYGLLLLSVIVYPTYKTVAILKVFHRHTFTNNSFFFLAIKYIVIFLLGLNIIVGVIFYLVVLGYIYFAVTEHGAGFSGIPLGLALIAWVAVFVPLRILYIPIHVEYRGV